jgi:pheromone shutdown protein TraB
MFTYQESEQEINGLPYQMRSFDFNNIGVELVAEWYKRNLFIYRNILENSNENDRILVIIGSGHIFYLNQLLENNSEFNMINPNKFLNQDNE